jgi:predicted ATPase
MAGESRRFAGAREQVNNSRRRCYHRSPATRWTIRRTHNHLRDLRRSEHLQASKLKREKPADHLILILDEIESHLHPKWQRVILPALLGVAERLKSDLRIQILTATHSPLILPYLSLFESTDFAPFAPTGDAEGDAQTTETEEGRP